MTMPLTRPFIAAVMLLGVACGSSAAVAQPPARSSADLDRVRRQLSTPESIFVGPVRADYTVRVEDSSDDLDYHFGYLYDRTTATPGYIRPWYPIYHYQLQSMMIPLEHRAQLYPAGVPVGGSTFGALKGVFRKRQARAAKKQVEAEAQAIRKAH